MTPPGGHREAPVGPTGDPTGSDPADDRTGTDPTRDPARAPTRDPAGSHAGSHGGGPTGPGPALRLRPPRHQVDRRAVALWSVQAALSTVALLVPLAAVAAAVRPAQPWSWLVTGVAAAAGAGYVAAMPRIRHRVHRWEVTGEAVYAKSGWLTHEWRVAPLSRVQTVDARRGPLDQVFGLASVRITTASASGDVAIDGLDHRLAADLVEWLTARTQATPGDAT